MEYNPNLVGHLFSEPSFSRVSLEYRSYYIVISQNKGTCRLQRIGRENDIRLQSVATLTDERVWRREYMMKELGYK